MAVAGKLSGDLPSSPADLCPFLLSAVATRTVLRYHQNSRQLFVDNCGQPALNFVLIFFACLAQVNDYD